MKNLCVLATRGSPSERFRPPKTIKVFSTSWMNNEEMDLVRISQECVYQKGLQNQTLLDLQDKVPSNKIAEKYLDLY